MNRWMKGGTTAFACLLLVGTDGARAASQLVTNLEARKPQVIVAYGTSLTAGGAWVAQLRDLLNQRYPNLVTLHNSGGSGMWSAWGVANLDTLVLQKKPDVVFIEFGINDSVERFHGSVAQARTNVVNLVDRILADNAACQIVLMTMTPGDQYPEGHHSYRKDIAAYYEMYRTVAKERGLLLVDLYVLWQALQAKDPARFKAYVPDSIHPTAEGCAEIVTPAIARALGLSAAP